MHTLRRMILIVGTIILVASGGHFVAMYAASLTIVRDLVSTSAPSTAATHSIQFTATTAIPASGQIVIVPQAGSFQIPAGFDFGDVDLALSTGGPYTDRTLAALASALDDGVSVVTGTSGSITITLNSVSGIAAGSNVRILLGTNSISGQVGDTSLVNPSSAASYRVTITSKNASALTLDSAQAMVAVVRPVTTLLENQNVAPVLSNGLPSGTIAAGNSRIELSLETGEPASCRFATTSDTLYSAMTNSFSSVNSFTFFTAVSGHQDNTSYTYYVRCADGFLLANTSDYVITFTLDETPISNTSIPSSGGSGQGGTGVFAGGSSVLYLSSVRLSGWASPQSTVYVMRDGVQTALATAASSGRFENTISSLERGSYSFAAYAIDRKNRKSGTYASTLTLSQGSSNSITDIVIPPTIELKQAAVALGEDVVVFGESVPGGVIELYVIPSKANSASEAQLFTATTSRGFIGVQDGVWEVTIEGSSLNKGSYDIRARVIISEQAASEYGRSVALGVGVAPSLNLGNRADINKDGKVNLTDFSILLSNWGGDDEDSDINSDGKINLADFSILLFNWTG